MLSIFSHPDFLCDLGCEYLWAWTYHSCVRCFGSNQQGCVQGRRAPCELPGCRILHPAGDRWCPRHCGTKGDSHTWSSESVPLSNKPGRYLLPQFCHHDIIRISDSSPVVLTPISTPGSHRLPSWPLPAGLDGCLLLILGG